MVCPRTIGSSIAEIANMFLSCVVTTVEPGVDSKELKEPSDSSSGGDSSCGGNTAISLGDGNSKKNGENPWKSQ